VKFSYTENDREFVATIREVACDTELTPQQCRAEVCRIAARWINSRDGATAVDRHTAAMLATKSISLRQRGTE
jgi:hypothetical protein